MITVERVIIEVKSLVKTVFSITPSDKSWIMTLPLIVLAIYTILEGIGVPLSEEGLELKRKLVEYFALIIVSAIGVIAVKMVSYFFKKDKEEIMKELDTEETI